MLVKQINVIYCNNNRAIIPCIDMSEQEVQAKLEELRAMPEVFGAWITITRRR